MTFSTDDSMSYPVIVAGKSVKLSPKTVNSNTNDAAMTEPSNAELSTIRSADSLDGANPNIQYMSAVDVTRMSDPSVASATVEETSSGIVIRRSLFTMSAALPLLSVLFGRI